MEPSTELDVCVLAGDIDCPLAASVDWAARIITPPMPVVLVPGNHEYYGDSLIAGGQQAMEAAERHPNVHLLILDDFVIGSVPFAKWTLWTDCELNATEDDQRERDLSIAYAIEPQQVFCGERGIAVDHATVHDL